MSEIETEHIYNTTSDSDQFNYTGTNVSADVILIVFFLIILCCCGCRCVSNGGIEGCLEGGDPNSLDRAQTRARNRIAARRASADNFLL